jgi:hypothetical protein
MNATGIDDRPRRIYNPVQRDAATFLETRGDRRRADTRRARGGSRREGQPALPPQLQRAVQGARGRLTIEIDGVRRDLEPNDEAVAAPRSLHAWSNPGKERSVAQIELRPGRPGFEKGLRVVYGLAADGLVRGNGVPRNPLHAALMLEMGEVRLPGTYAALERVLGLLARVARWRGVDRELERRYL